MSGRSFGLLVGAVLIGLALVANAIVSWVAVNALRDGYEQEERTYEKLRTLTLVLVAMQDAETGQRGFLLTGEEPYLDPYTRGVRRVDSLTARLDTYAADDELLASRLAELHGHIRRRLTISDQTIRLRRTQGFEAALSLVREGAGKEEMDAIRAIVSQVGRETRDELRAQTEASMRTSRRADLTIGLANLALLGMVVAVGVIIRRNIRQRERTTGELRAANAALSAALSERQAALAHVQAMQAQLVQQEKLASLGRLTAGVAHEMKNPLNFINNFASLVHEQADDVANCIAENNMDSAAESLADLRQNAERIVAHGRRADDIVRSMLVHARGVSGDREQVDLHAIMDTAVEQALGADAAERKPTIRIERHYDAALDGTAMQGVPSALGRLFLNLVENAAHAVWQRAGAEPEGYTPTITLSTELGEDRMGRPAAIVVVADNGTGIPDAVLPRVFEPFYTTKGPGQGTGLGLSLAYDIALGHGGTLVAEHTDFDESGASFVVTLPLAPPEEEEERVDK